MRVAKEYGDLIARDKHGIELVAKEGQVRFAEVEFGANKELCESLGVKKLPSVFFYSQGSKVDGFPCGPKKFSKLLSKVSDYRSMSPEELAFEADMNQGSDLANSFLESLQNEAFKTDNSGQNPPPSNIYTY